MDHETNTKRFFSSYFLILAPSILYTVLLNKEIITDNMLYFSIYFIFSPLLASLIYTLISGFIENQHNYEQYEDSKFFLRNGIFVSSAVYIFTTIFLCILLKNYSIFIPLICANIVFSSFSNIIINKYID